MRIFKCMIDAGADLAGPDSEGNTLRAFIMSEIERLTPMLETDSSGNLRKMMNQSIRNFSKSLKLLDSLDHEA